MAQPYTDTESPGSLDDITFLNLTFDSSLPRPALSNTLGNEIPAPDLNERFCWLSIGSIMKLLPSKFISGAFNSIV